MLCCVSSSSPKSGPTGSCCLVAALSKLAYLVKETALIVLLGTIVGSVPALVPASVVGYVAFLVTSSPEIAKTAGLVVWVAGALLGGWLVRPALNASRE